MKTILVTGANSGVGLALSRALVERGHAVIMAVRDVQRGDAARAELQSLVPDASVRVEPLDLERLDSVRALADRPFDVDVLVNNAAIAFEPMRLTAEGVHAQFGINHLGHFALTALLFERLSARGEGRVVHVTSTLAKKGTIDFDGLDGTGGFSSMRAYTESKIANILFGAELARRLRASDSNVRSVLVHPGVPATAMQQKAKGVIGVVARIVSALMGKPPSHGANAMLEAAINVDVQSGDLWEPGRTTRDAPRRVTPWPTMSSREDAARLWERSEALTGLRFL
ncbi:MAG: SDR family NAD(P)-dependent oxidoreductase [Polyangiaceae bacterium]|nr:SDR family NAD(P)-dependent oxidoreductase [Polyangiaceae bacterium]